MVISFLSTQNPCGKLWTSCSKLCENGILRCRSRKRTAFFTKGGIMDSKSVTQFKTECSNLLNKFGIHSLQTYGRALGLRKPTVLKKAVIIEKIVCVLAGEKLEEKRVNQGKPAINDFVDPFLSQKIEALKNKYFFNHTEESVKISSSMEVLEKMEDADSTAPPILRLIIQPSSLNTRQKQLLNEFLNSL